MLIPSIDLLGGRIVQLVQGEKLRLAFDDFEYWIEKFARFPMVQLIDLDAAMRQGDNSKLVAQIAKRHEATPAQVRLAWTLHQGPNVLAIPGTSSLAHLEENVAAGELELSGEDLTQLNSHYSAEQVTEAGGASAPEVSDTRK